METGTRDWQHFQNLLNSQEPKSQCISGGKWPYCTFEKRHLKIKPSTTEETISHTQEHARKVQLSFSARINASRFTEGGVVYQFSLFSCCCGVFQNCCITRFSTPIHWYFSPDFSGVATLYVSWGPDPYLPSGEQFFNMNLYSSLKDLWKCLLISRWFLDYKHKKKSITKWMLHTALLNRQ